MFKETYLCSQGSEPWKPYVLDKVCTEPNSKWEAIEYSKLHLSATSNNGTIVCLDVDSDYTISQTPTSA